MKLEQIKSMDGRILSTKMGRKDCYWVFTFVIVVVGVVSLLD